MLVYVAWVYSCPGYLFRSKVEPLVLRQQNVNNVIFVWSSAAAATFNKHPLSVWYPGDDVVDWVCISVFQSYLCICMILMFLKFTNCTYCKKCWRLNLLVNTAVTLARKIKYPASCAGYFPRISVCVT